jgi:hypothetical protein
MPSLYTIDIYSGQPCKASRPLELPMLSQAEWNAFVGDFNTIIMDEYVRGSRRKLFAQASGRVDTVSKQMQGLCHRVSLLWEVAHGLGLTFSTEATWKSNIRCACE